MHFTLKIDVTAHAHAYSPTAHRSTVAHLIDHARQQIASGDATRGDLIYPPGSGIVLGSWQFESARP